MESLFLLRKYIKRLTWYNFFILIAGGDKYEYCRLFCDFCNLRIGYWRNHLFYYRDKRITSAIKTEDVNLLDNGFKFISVAKGLFAVAVSLFLLGMFAIIYNYIKMTGFRNFILLIRGIP